MRVGGGGRVEDGGGLGRSDQREFPIRITIIPTRPQHPHEQKTQLSNQHHFSYTLLLSPVVISRGDMFNVLTPGAFTTSYKLNSVISGLSLRRRERG